MKWKKNQIEIKLTLLLIIGIIGILSISLFTYSAFKSLRHTVKEFQYPDQKIKHLNSLSDQINNSDLFLRLYSITKKKEYINNYYTCIDSVNLLFTLYRDYITGDTFKTQQVDTINLWWNEKLHENTALLKLNNDKPDILVIGKIVDNSMDTTLYSTQIQNEKVIHDSIVIIREIPIINEQHTSLLSKMRKIFERKDETDSLLTNDTIPKSKIHLYSYTYKTQDTIYTDTLVKLESFNKINKDAVKSVLQEKIRYDTIVNLKRLAAIEKNVIIRNKIANQIKCIQKQEQADAAKNIAVIQNISTDTINQILWIFVFIFIICAVLYLLLVWDTFKIKRYEEKLLLQKNNYQNLANNRSQFLSMIAHELRTPLQSVIGFSELLYLQNENTGNKTFHYSDIIHKSSSHLLQTINLLLDRSKIDSGKLKIENISFNLYDCVRDVFESLHIQAKEKHIDYTYVSNIPQELTVFSDSFRLKQVLYNLLSNAVKFTENGAVELHISSYLEKNNHIEVFFKISDTGIGIPKHKIKNLFNEFDQLNDSIERLYGGTGLGLVITKKLLTLFNSEITVESEEQKGTSFSFYINFEKSIPIIKKIEEPTETLNISVLVIDDDNYNLLFTHQILSKYVQDVRFSESIEDAKRILQNTIPDIVFCDMYIGHNMGTEIIPYLNEKTKIIFISADHDQLKKSPYQTLSKPYSSKDLLMFISDKITVQNDNTQITDPIHLTSLHEKLKIFHKALQENETNAIISILHQLKTTLGYLNKWEEIKQIQKIENTYSVHKNIDVLHASSLVFYEHCKKLF